MFWHSLLILSRDGPHVSPTRPKQANRVTIAVWDPRRGKNCAYCADFSREEPSRCSSRLLLPRGTKGVRTLSRRSTVSRRHMADRGRINVCLSTHSRDYAAHLRITELLNDPEIDVVYNPVCFAPPNCRIGGDVL
jgi:hypothetical protein